MLLPLMLQSNFMEFLERIIGQCQHSILYDEYMLDTLLVWLVGLTDSTVTSADISFTPAPDETQ